MAYRPNSIFNLSPNGSFLQINVPTLTRMIMSNKLRTGAKVALKLPMGMKFMAACTICMCKR